MLRIVLAAWVCSLFAHGGVKPQRDARKGKGDGKAERDGKGKGKGWGACVLPPACLGIRCVCLFARAGKGGKGNAPPAKQQWKKPYNSWN